MALISILAGFFWNLQGAPLFDLDEGAFSEATREMLERGDLITPTLYGEPRHDKPILIYWLQAASVSLLGIHEYAFRLPSAIAAALWAGLAYAFLARIKGRREGLYAAILLSTTLSITAIGKAATADALLNLWLAASLLSAFLYLREGRRLFLYGSFGAMGLGMLTKGPVAILIPGAVTFLYCASRGELRTWFRAALDARGWGLLLAIALPWYGIQTFKDGGAFVKDFLLTHNVSRFRAPMEGHGGAFFYYIPVLLIGLLPHTHLALGTLSRLTSLWRADEQRFLVMWFALVFLFFSLSGTKLPHYLNYGYTGLILLMALHLDRFSAAFWILLPALLLEAFLLALPWLLPLSLPHIHDAFYREALEGARFGLDYPAFFALSTLLVLFLMVKKTWPLPERALISAVVVTFGLSAYLFPLAGEILQSPVKEAALKARAWQGPLVMWGINTPSFCVYAERIAERRRPQPGDLVFTKKARLADIPRFEPVYQRAGVALVVVKP
ncbi:MAG: glycosyltransferase family 39 protein [Gammaproteobacteria bacterium]|nr:MAG: glycosyltransferase family 39 protein [Gammaproteobacteria bacterium]